MLAAHDLEQVGDSRVTCRQKPRVIADRSQIAMKNRVDAVEAAYRSALADERFRVVKRMFDYR